MSTLDTAPKVVDPGCLPPSYSEAVGVKRTFRHMERSGHMFPEKFYVSPKSPESSVKWVLGEYRHQPLFAISRREQSSGNKPSVILHDGLSLRDPTLASFRCIQSTPRTWKVHLPPSDAETVPSLELVSGGTDWRAQKRPLLKFSVKTAVCDQREEFEWRSSNNDNIRALLGGQSLGWKLVRLSKDAFTDQIPAPDGAWPRTNNGAEIVAVFCSSGTTVDADWRFAFMGTGANGVLGGQWEIMAVTTSLILMDTSIRTLSQIQ